MNDKKLYAVLLGGKAKGTIIEQHDIAFAIAPSFEETWPTLIESWFGLKQGVHADGYVLLDQVDGFRIELSEVRPDTPERLFFINLGGYIKGQFIEHHINTFVVAKDAAQAKSIAKSGHYPEVDLLHTDSLIEVDSCLELRKVDNFYIQLIADPMAKLVEPVHGYYPLTADAV